MRVLTLYYEHRPGGMMQMIYRMLLGGAERGWDMHYLSVAPFAVSHPRLTRHHLPSPRGHDSLAFWAWFFLAAPAVALVLARRLHVDLLAVFEGSYAWAMLPAKRALALPLVVFLQSDVATINRLHGRPAAVRQLEQRMEKAGLCAADRIVATNETLADVVRARWQLPESKITVVPNNVRLPALSPPESRAALAAALGLAPDAFLIATSGVFSPRKNLALLLAAFAGVTSERAHLIVIGEGPDRAAWHEVMRAAGAGPNGGRIHFLGWRDDVPQVLSGCDLFVFPSRHEGSPLSLIEALRVGLPCLGSDVAEIREVLGESELTFGVDNVGGLGVLLERAVAEPDFQARLRRLSRERAARYAFDWEARVIEIMSAAAGGKP